MHSFIFRHSEPDVDTAKYAALFKQLEEDLIKDTEDHILPIMNEMGSVNKKENELMGEKIARR